MKILALLAILLPAVAAAQMRLSLQQNEPIPIMGIQGGLNMGQVRCDRDGNLYFRTYVAEQIYAAPVVRVAPDGNSYVSFEAGPWKQDPNAMPQVRDYTIQDLSVFLLTQSDSPQQQILRFDTDGKYKTTYPLEARWTAARIAAFPQGGLFVIGVKKAATPRNPGAVTTVAGVFEPSGRLIREVPLTLATPDENSTTLDLVDRMLIDSGPSGVYLMPYSRPFLVAAISPSGDISRRIMLPDPGESYLPNSLHATGNQLIVEYARSKKGQPDQKLFVFYDSGTGKPATYYDASAVQGSFACYDTNHGFTFLSEKDAQRVIVRATAQ